MGNNDWGLGRKIEEHVFLSQAVKPKDVGLKGHPGIAIMIGAQVWGGTSCSGVKELLGEGKKPQWVTSCVPDEKDCTGIGKARLEKSESLGLTHFGVWL